MARIMADTDLAAGGFTVTARHPSGLKRPFLELAIDWLERDDLSGDFSVSVGEALGLYDFRFTDARTALAFKMRWG